MTSELCGLQLELFFAESQFLQRTRRRLVRQIGERGNQVGRDLFGGLPRLGRLAGSHMRRIDPQGRNEFLAGSTWRFLTGRFGFGDFASSGFGHISISAKC